MDKNSEYARQVQLLVRLLPLVAQQECFALKGGTAINLFVRGLPRLSVDIDLTYLPLEPRDKALANINTALVSIKTSVEKALTDVSVRFSGGRDSQRLVIQSKTCQVKIELSPVLRGTVHPPILLEIDALVEKMFGYAEMQVVSFNDLYAGKLCAALDRQHPRDLFDIKLLLDHEGLSQELIQTFIVYLISHPRPIVELLAPNTVDIKDIFEVEFGTMARVPVTLDGLIDVQKTLAQRINEYLTDKQRQFLMSFKARKPDWALLGVEKAQSLPAVKWKMINLNKMSDQKHETAMKKLEEVLFANKA
tara:strand:- start:4590 stop:5507 length:918 start_codon:yes stop_codon:yes gene_type:complete